MRELKDDELKIIIKAAQQALPNDVKDCGIIILCVAETVKGTWINRISNMQKHITNRYLLKWAQKILNDEEFGMPVKN